MLKYKCINCFKTPLSKEEIGITKKILDPNAKEFYCLDCLAQLLDVTKEDLLDKIEEFKEEGCTLFK